MLTIQEIAEMMDGTILDGDPCITINDYSYSSKEGDAQTLFLPVVGERKDGHDFIADAGSTGMIATVTERDHTEENTPGMTYIAIDNTRDAIQRLGMRYRKCFNVKCVGITGSVGKTTTKEMIAAALEPSFSLIKTTGNKNGQLGLPLMVLKLDEKTECMVLEMGVSIPGEMERLAPIAAPTLAVVTNIGYSHVGNYGSRELIRREKLAIINEMDADGVLLLNGENELLSELCPGSPFQKDMNEITLYDKTAEVMGNIKRMSYGFSKWCDYRAENVVTDANGTEFDFVYKDYRKKVRLSVSGLHNVLNAVAALASCLICDGDADKAAEELTKYKPLAMRGNLEILSDGVYLLDDSYNASPDSMQSGLWLMDKVNNPGRKIAVLGDMFELGEYTEECHRTVGKYAGVSKADLVIAVGEAAEFIAKEASAAGKNVMYCREKAEAEEWLLANAAKGDLVLCKGSRGMKLDETAKLLRERAKN